MFDDLDQTTERIIRIGQDEAAGAIAPQLGPTRCNSAGVVPAPQLVDPWRVVLLFLAMMLVAIGITVLAVFPESEAETIRQWAVSWLP